MKDNQDPVPVKFNQAEWDSVKELLRLCHLAVATPPVTKEQMRASTGVTATEIAIHQRVLYGKEPK